MSIRPRPPHQGVYVSKHVSDSVSVPVGRQVSDLVWNIVDLATWLDLKGLPTWTP